METNFIRNMKLNGPTISFFDFSSFLQLFYLSLLIIVYWRRWRLACSVRNLFMIHIYIHTFTSLHPSTHIIDIIQPTIFPQKAWRRKKGFPEQEIWRFKIQDSIDGPFEFFSFEDLIWKSGKWKSEKIEDGRWQLNKKLIERILYM